MTNIIEHAQAYLNGADNNPGEIIKGLLELIQLQNNSTETLLEPRYTYHPHAKDNI